MMLYFVLLFLPYVFSARTVSVAVSYNYSSSSRAQQVNGLRLDRHILACIICQKSKLTVHYFNIVFTLVPANGTPKI